MVSAETSPKKAESPRAPHVCQLCNRSYERADHLNRHLDSHRNERTFKCNDCPRGFNRRDLLLRHQATHAKNAANGKTGPDRTAERAIKACDPCVISKLKCDNSRPCQRCKKRKIECKSDTLNQMSSAPTPDGSSPANEISRTLSQESRNGLPSPPDTAAEVRRHSTAAAPPCAPDNVNYDSTSMPLDQLAWQTTDMGSLLPFPSFFEQIMAPDFVATDSLNMPPDIFNWMPDKDWLNDTSDIFGHDFTPTVDQAIQAQIEDFPFPEQPSDALAVQAEVPQTQNSAKERHAIFQRSQWLWKPSSL